MKPRLTIRQHLVVALSKRIRVTRVRVKAHWFMGAYLKAYDRWEIQIDGRQSFDSGYYSGTRAQMQCWRLEVIEKQASALMSSIRSLKTSGFKIVPLTK
jgi:hypothetical protein